MPLLKRKPFTPEKPPTDLKPREEVFVCRHTNEVFTDYESFFKRTILCNSLVWSCKFTGKGNLTYHEALESEQEIIKRAESLSAPLQRAALTLVHHIQRGRLANLCDEVFSYLKDRYQEGEDVEVQYKGKRKKGKIQKVIEPDSLSNGLDNTSPKSPKSRKLSSSSNKEKKAEKSTGTPAKIRKSSTADSETPTKSRKESESNSRSPGKARSLSDSSLNSPGRSRKNSSKDSATSPKSAKKSKDIDSPSPKLKKPSDSEKLKSPKSKTASCKDSETDVIVIEDESTSSQAKENKGESNIIKSPKSKMGGFWPDPTTYTYAVKLYPDKDPKKKDVKPAKEVVILEFNYVCRKKGTFTRDRLKNFLKLSCERSTQTSDDGIYFVKVEYRKRFDLSDPLFEIPSQLMSPSRGKSTRKRKKPTKDGSSDSSPTKKKRLKGEGERNKKTAGTQSKKLTHEERLKIMEEERMKRRISMEEDKEKRRIQKEQEKLEQKTKREEERAQKKIERDQEREKLREQKRQDVLLLKEWSRPREDLELDDLQDLPEPQPIEVRIANELFGDAVMVLEFFKVFGSLFDIKDEFPSGLNFLMLEEALAEQDSEGVYYDLLQFLLGAILRTHMEEEEDEGLESADAQTPIELDNEEYHKTKVSASAAIAAVWPILHQGKPLHELIMDPFTCSELLRLHLLSSGARVGCGDPEYRWQSRGGFTYADDAGVAFRHREPHIMKALMTATVYDLSAEEKLKILTALCGQLMTYATFREYVDDGFDKLKKVRREWLSDQWAEQRREKEEATARYHKRQEDRLKQKEELEKKKKDKENEKDDGKQTAEAETSSQNEGKPAEEAKSSNEDRKKGKGRRRSSKDPEKEIGDKKRADETEEKSMHAEDEEKQEDVVLSKEEEEQLAVQRKLDRDRKEQDHLSIVRKAVSMSNVQPLGRDRIYRRYWIFRSLKGLFVEEDDPDLPRFLETIFEEENCEEGKEKEGNFEEKATDGEPETKEQTDKNENKPREITEEKEKLTPHVETFGGLKSVLKTDLNKMKTDSTKNKLSRDEIIAKYGQREGYKRWSFISGANDFECLVNALNPRGQRERVLREALQLDFKYLANVIAKCPFKEENLVSKKIPRTGKTKKQQAIDKSRYENTDDFVEANLRDQILDLEDRLWQGGLGVTKVEDRSAWRAKVENGIYNHLKDSDAKEDANGAKAGDEVGRDSSDVTMKDEKDGELVNGVSLKGENETPIDEELPAVVKRETPDDTKVGVLTNGDTEEENEMETEPELAKAVQSESHFVALLGHLKLDLSGSRPSSPPDSRTGTPVISLAPGSVLINPATKELALALLKVEQGIESKYLSPPLGEDEETKRQKQKDAAAMALAEFSEMMKAAEEGKETNKEKRRKSKAEKTNKEDGEGKDDTSDAVKKGGEDSISSSSSTIEDTPKQKTCLERWEESLMACTSLAQVFVHLNTLDGSITWSKSVLNARCRLCRRKGDAEKMLLCDACDRGHHMYCLKPPIREIPEGNWFCPDCRPKETRRSERRRRVPAIAEDEDEEEDEEEEDDSEEEEESDDETDFEEDSEEGHASEADSEHVDQCAFCEQDGELLCCDVCPLAYHVDCAYPSLRRIPRGNWACQVCTGADEERPKKCRVKKSTIKAALHNAREKEKQKSNKSSARKPNKKRSPSPYTPKTRGRKESTDSAPRSSKKRRIQDTSPSSTSSQPRKGKRNVPSSLRIRGRSSVESSRSPSPVRKSATKRDPRLTGRMVKCGKLLGEVMKHMDADFFLEPVRLSKYPTYNTNPMDLETIQINVKENAYDTVDDFISDVRKVFIDCAEFFRPRAKEARAGVRLSAFFETRLSEMGLDAGERSVRSCRKT